MSWIGDRYRQLGFARTFTFVVAVIAFVLFVSSQIGIYCNGGARRYFPAPEVIGWATTHAHDKAKDALLVEIELVRVASDGTIDRRGNDPMATLRFRAPSYGARCELRIEVRGWEYTTLLVRAPKDADYGVGCRAPSVRAPICDAAAIWQRALHDGASPGAPAVLTYAAPAHDHRTPRDHDPDQPIAGQWTFELGTFTRTYDDDCGAPR